MHRGADEHRVKKRSFVLLLLISSVFAHTHCISLSVTPLNPLGVTAPLTSKGRRGVRHGHGGFASLGTANRNTRRGSAEKRKKSAKKPSPPRRRGLLVCNKIICTPKIRRCGGLKRFSTSRGKIQRHSPRFEKRNGRKSFRSREWRPGEAFHP